MRVLMKSGTIVNADGRVEQNLLIESRIVRQLGTDISSQLPCEEVDASGCYVFPGGVDVHTHFNTDVGIVRSYDDSFTGTRTAVCGGATTIIDHTGFGPSGCRLRHQLGVYHSYAARRAVIDYSFHSIAQHINHAILGEILTMAEEGLSSSKLYLIYRYKLNDDEVLQALHRLHESGAPTTVHPENDAATANKRAEFIAAGLTVPCYYASSRPLEREAEVATRMINLAQIAGNTPLCIVHLSDGLGLDYLRLACADHQPVWAKTCPQYPLLDECDYDTENDMRFILSPPPHNIREQDKLWCDTSDGVTDVVAIDHCTFSVAQHLQIFKGDFSRCLNSSPNVESRTQLLFSSGVMMGRISLERLVGLTSVMPARLFDLWPQKGISASGSDSDVVIIDPRRGQQIQHRHLHDNADYSPWEGFTCQGAVVRTLSCGEAIFCDDTLTGKVRRGRFLRRKPFVPPVL